VVTVKTVYKQSGQLGCIGAGAGCLVQNCGGTLLGGIDLAAQAIPPILHTSC